jgi:hypothetical protein
MGPSPTKFTVTRWCQASRRLVSSSAPTRKIEGDRTNRQHARAPREQAEQFGIWGPESDSIVSQRVVGIRMAVPPIVGVRWHPGHPDRNSSNRVHDVSRNVCSSGIDTSTCCEVGTEWGRRQGRGSIMLPKVKPHRARSDGTETQTAIRTWERRFTGIGSMPTTTLRRDRRLVNE